MLQINENIPGWKDKEGMLYIAEAMQKMPEYAKIVDVGCGVGRLTWVMARNAPRSSSVFGIDTWSYEPVDTTGNPYCYHCEGVVRSRKNFLRYTSDCKNIVPIQSLSPLEEWSYGSVDFVFIDVDNDYEMVHNNIEYWLGYLSPNGIIGGDDWLREESRNYERFLKTRNAVMDCAQKYNKKIIAPKDTNMWFFS